MGNVTSISNYKREYFRFIDKHVSGDPEGITVVSTFDGLSGLQIALQRLGVKVKKYYVFEIDIYGMSVTRKHFPKTVFLGDITKADPSFFDNIKVDFFSGGFPCQNYSFAGNRTGTQGETGKLLYPMMELFKALRKNNPNMHFFFENVKMKKEFVDEVSEEIGARPQLWNSALVSGQNRQRFYWTSLKHINFIEDRNILLEDVLEPVVDAKYCVNRNLVKEYQGKNKPSAFASRGRYNADGSTSQQMEFRFDGKTNTVTTVQKDNYVTMSDNMGVDVAITEGVDLVGSQGKEVVRTNIHKGSALMARDYKGFGNQAQTGVRCIQVGEADIRGLDAIKRVYSPLGKSPTLTTMGGGHREPKVITSETTFRKLTPKECERLQTLDDDYTAYGVTEKGETVKISDTQRYKMIGNGWTIEMIVELLRDYQPKMAIAV